MHSKDDVKTARQLIEQLESDAFQSAPEPVSHNSNAHPLRNDESETCGRRRRITGEHAHREALDTLARSPSHDLAIIIAARDSVRASEQLRLRGELGATLAAARSEDRATRACAHPQTEAVHLGTTAVVRLERTLRHEQTPE